MRTLLLTLTQQKLQVKKGFIIKCERFFERITLLCEVEKISLSSSQIFRRELTNDLPLKEHPEKKMLKITAICFSCLSSSVWMPNNREWRRGLVYCAPNVVVYLIVVQFLCTWKILDCLIFNSFSSQQITQLLSRPLTIVSVAYLIANWVSHEIYLTFLLMKEKNVFAMMLLTSHIRAAASTQTWFLHMFFLYILACTIMIQKLKWHEKVLHQKIPLHHTTFNFIHVIKFNKYFPSPLEIH